MMVKRGDKEKKSKQPKRSQTPTTIKQAKHIQNPEGYESQLIAWHFNRMDRGGTWPCTHETLKSISARLHEYEQKKWYEALRARRNHPMPVGKIDPPAQSRLDKLGYADASSLYQLEIKNGKGKQRLWGLRQENVFQILWWDPYHTVCPSYKKYT